MDENQNDTPHVQDSTTADQLIGAKDQAIPEICHRLAVIGHGAHLAAALRDDKQISNQDITKLTQVAVELLSTVAMVNSDKHPMSLTREQLLVDNALAARESYLMELAMGNIANMLMDPRAQALPAHKVRGMVLQLVMEGLECRAAHSQNAKSALDKLERGDIRRADGEVSKRLTLVKSE